MNFVVEIIGWGAALLILFAYALLSIGRLKPHSGTYQWMNMVGAAGFVLNSGWNGAFPSAVVNVIWIGIGAYALLHRRKVT